MAEILRFDRTFDADVVVRSGGSGRLVEAYAAVWDRRTEIKDQHGHYMESIHRNAFDLTLQDGFDHVVSMYNHGFDLHGAPSGLGSVPIGSPVDIKPDQRGLWTLTRFNNSRLADAVLEAIRSGDIKAYSFRGRIYQSHPERIERAARGGGPLPSVTRLRLGLAEYGPTPSAAYKDAAIIGVRAA